MVTFFFFFFKEGNDVTSRVSRENSYIFTSHSTVLLLCEFVKHDFRAKDCRENQRSFLLIINHNNALGNFLAFDINYRC